MAIYINLAAIQRNWKCMDERCQGRAGAMVKANAYGLGAKEVTTALFEAGCRTFFVATAEEASIVRPCVGDSVIYALHGALNEEEVRLCVEYNIRPVLNNIQAWSFLNGLGVSLNVGVHVDTGMRRLGVPEYEVDEFVDAVHSSSILNVCLVMSHFVASEEVDNPINEQQKTRFKHLADKFPGAETSLANSHGVLLGNDFQGDVTRPGIALYGGVEGLESVLSIKPRVLQVQKVFKGQSVGYNAAWVAEEDCFVASVEVGYADINPINYMKIINRQSMDMLTLVFDNDLFASDNFKIYPEINGVAGYHALTSLSQRLKRSYIYE